MRKVRKKRQLTADQRRFNQTATARKHGTIKSKQVKRYIFGHQTNVRKGRA